ncbi:MAG: hypothetical protein KatS3mg031_2532 [Chitinophagales bacterium]|nr:MAG: hypothetical protein KatS3mg031_2532 [Chitinophagales bacterium]
MVILVVLLLALSFTYLLLIVFYYHGWKNTPVFLPSEHFTPQTAISVIIAVRNEEENIETCLQSLLAQDYPAHLMEIILVNDHSEDNTMHIVAQTKGKKKITLLHLPENVSGKKQAIQAGIVAAKGKLVVTTDGDCIAGRKWLKTIAEYYEKHNPVMIAGPVAIEKETGWLEKWQSLDLCGMMVITAGAIAQNFPNMCNAANLAYIREAFYMVNGFEGTESSPGGDDVLLMMKLNRKYPGRIMFLKSPPAIVYTRPVSSMGLLMQQRIRWVSKANIFPDHWVTAVLLGVFLLCTTILIGFSAGLFTSTLLVASVSALALKGAADFIILRSGTLFFGRKRLMIGFPIAELLHVVYVVVVGFAAKVIGYRWKGRSYHPLRKKQRQQLFEKYF